jgi:hypothetical protein
MCSSVPSGQPADSRSAVGDNGGGFFRRDDPGALAAFRETFGAEAFEPWQRSQELLIRPRPLAEWERAVLQKALAPLLADLAASGLSLPDIREEAHEEREAASVCAWIQGPERTGAGIWILVDSPPAEQVAQLAEQFQNWAADELHDAGRPPDWPGCPEHPGALHRLEPEVRDGAAVWVCLESGQVIWQIGAVVLPGGYATRQTRRRGRRSRRP